MSNYWLFLIAVQLFFITLLLQEIAIKIHQLTDKSMNSSQFFKVDKNHIGYIGSNFQDNFMDMDFTVPKKVDLKTRKLERNMTDKEILSEFKPKESNLGELVYTLENDTLSKNGYANIFYIRSKNNVLWAVGCYWYSDSGSWNVYANSVEVPGGWNVGYRVVSCDFGDSEPVKVNETLTIGNYEILEKRVKVLENKISKIKEIL